MHWPRTQALKANPDGAPKELKISANRLTRFGQVALQEALDMVRPSGLVNLNLPFQCVVAPQDVWRLYFPMQCLPRVLAACRLPFQMQSCALLALRSAPLARNLEGSPCCAQVFEMSRDKKEITIVF